METYTIYDTISGKILRKIMTGDQDDVFLNLGENEGFIVSDSNFDEEIVDIISRQVVSRQASPAIIDVESITANNIDLAIISNVSYSEMISTGLVTGENNNPMGTIIFNDGVRVISVTSEQNPQLEFKTNTPGTYEIKIIGFPYLPKTFTVTAT